MRPARVLHALRPLSTEDRARREGQEAQGRATSGRSCSTPSDACSCSRCLRFEDVVTGTNALTVREARRRHRDRDLRRREDRARLRRQPGRRVPGRGASVQGSSASRCGSGSWSTTPSVCPGCSTGCNVFVDERDGEVQRLRPRRNADVNKSWMCDPGRALYKEIGVTERLGRARARRRRLGRHQRRRGARPGGRGPASRRAPPRPSSPRRRRPTRTSSPSRRSPRPWAGRSTSASATRS